MIPGLLVTLVFRVYFLISAIFYRMTDLDWQDTHEKPFYCKSFKIRSNIVLLCLLTKK